jgi:hypothetical protein
LIKVYNVNVTMAAGSMVEVQSKDIHAVIFKKLQVMPC